MRRLIKMTGGAIASLCLGLAPSVPAAALSGDALAENIANRSSTLGRTSAMIFELTNRKGKQRIREAVVYHREHGEKLQIALHFNSPASIDGAAFLSHDHKDEMQTDETWLFMPAAERVRRLPASERGDAFMGTDLSYGDVKDNFKFGLADYDFELLEAGVGEGGADYRLAGEAKSPAIVKETGYSRFEALIDGETWFPMEITYFDVDGDRLKTSKVERLENVDGAWVATDFIVTNVQREHVTRVKLEGLRSVPGLEDRIFEPGRLDLGAPEIE
ncbi:MAG: outer membrane lipoprotein-sorting protein [Pseudomonadota bacterium]